MYQVQRKHPFGWADARFVNLVVGWIASDESWWMARDNACGREGFAGSAHGGCLSQAECRIEGRRYVVKKPITVCGSRVV